MWHYSHSLHTTTQPNINDPTKSAPNCTKYSTQDGNDIFEITDFTTASDFERFVARLEEVIHEWKLTSTPKSPYTSKEFDINSAQWKEVSEEIMFIDFPFVVTHHFVKYKVEEHSKVTQSMSDASLSDAESPEKSAQGSWPGVLDELHYSQQDFPGKAHCLCRWFGLTSFVVISPKSYALTHESRIKTVLSAITLAIQSSACMVPIFVQSLEMWRKFYLGQFQSGGIETKFEMIHLKHIPDKFRHLSGLIDVFKGKLNAPIDPVPKVCVSIRFAYILQDWEEYMFDWPQTPPDVTDSLESPAIGLTQIDTLPFGACQDPITDLYLFTTWANISEEVVTESDVYSDLDPMQAPLWTVRVTMAQDIQCLLADSLQSFADLCSRSETFEQVLGTRHKNIDEDEITSALERLTSPQTQYNIPSLAKVTKAVSNTRLRLSNRTQDDSPIPIDVLNKILVHLFPDAKDDEQIEDQCSEEDQTAKEMYRFYKTAPADSPVFKLAVCCCLVNYAFGGLKAVAHLWHEFVLEMRYRLENSIRIPGMEKGHPNLAQGIIYQKIQMLNCCIEKKLSRDQDQSNANSMASNSASQTVSHSNEDDSITESDPLSGGDGNTNSAKEVLENDRQSTSDENDDDEFFECDSEASESSKSRTDSTVTPSKTSDESDSRSNSASEKNSANATPLVDNCESDSDKPDASTSKLLHEEGQKIQPKGRLRQLEDLRLINVDDALYIPVTQEPAPMTEDLLAEHAEVLTRLGTSAEGANLRAKMQSASLVSDMESFKAANPGCILEDFVRWYSPRDYIIQTVIDSETGDTVEKGGLSERMLVPGNMWQEVWENAKPVSARRQKRLFNDTKEAEKVLHFLSNLKPAQVVLHLLPMVCQSAILVTKQQGEEMMPSISPMISHIISKLENVTRHHTQSANIYSEAISQLKTAELVIARALSLHLKFACDGANKSNEDVKNFVLDLMNLDEVKVIGASRGPVGKTLTKMFADAKAIQEEDSFSEQQQKEQLSPDATIFPVAAAREYILRTVTPRPAPYSKSFPQRMYCTLIDGQEYRLAGAFSSDITFQ